MKRNLTWRTIGAIAVTAMMAASQAFAASYVIRFSHGMPEVMASDQHAYAVVFKNIVEAETGGDIEVRILGNNQAGAERQQLEKVQTNINQMCNVSEGTQHSFFKPAMVLGIPIEDVTPEQRAIAKRVCFGAGSEEDALEQLRLFVSIGNSLRNRK